MHFTAAGLVFCEKCLNAFDAEADHGLVADDSGKFLVIHFGDVEMSSIAVNAHVRRRRCVAKGFREATDFRPPFEGFDSIRGGKNGDGGLDDGIHAAEGSRVMKKTQLSGALP